MSEQTLNLMQDFPPATYEAWRDVVEKALRGTPFDKKLVTRLHDGIALQPIYTEADWSADGDASGFPGVAPFVRGANASGAVGRGWDIRQAFVHPDIKRTNTEILADLERGVTSILLRFDQAARHGLDGDTERASDLAGRDGVMIYCADDLDSALAGVMLDIAPVALDAGAGAPAAAAFLAEVWRKRGVTGEDAHGAFNIDPIGTLGAMGQLPLPLDAALAQMAGIAAKTARELPNVTAVGVNSSAYTNAGATDVQDLGYAMATAVTYLRAMTDAGMPIDDACRQIAFTIPVGTDFFLSIAKLRAARLLWARIAEACGASEGAASMRLHADTADRMLSQRDPWVNVLRVTVACFAAGIAGADSVTAAPFSKALGLPDDFARRIARNTQIILQEESNLARVIDPAGGSWYVEALTRQVAERAWAEVQDIEKLGGMAKAVASGDLVEKLDASWQERRGAIAQRKDQLTGVNEFPNLAEKPVDLQPADIAVLRKAASRRLTHNRRTVDATDTEALFQVAKDGTLGALTAAFAGDPATVPPLPVHRLAEDFELLRDASDAYMETTGARPRVFLANIGRIAQHTARATYARNFFEAGGIEAVPGQGATDVAALVEEFKASGAALGCLCGSDALYEEKAADFAQALKAAGVTRVYLAGRPGERKADYDAAGVDEYVFMGCDALGILGAAQTYLGVR